MLEKYVNKQKPRMVLNFNVNNANWNQYFKQKYHHT